MNELFQRRIAEAGVPYSPLIGIAAMMRQAVTLAHLTALGAVLKSRIAAHPTDANALLDYSTVLQLTGDLQTALRLQDHAIRLRSSYTLPGPGDGAAITLLVIMGPGALMWNTPVELLTERSDIQVKLLFLPADAQWPLSVPDHDVLLVGVAESQDNLPLLQRLAIFLAEWPRPVINQPARIARLARDRVSDLLQGIAGLQMPLTQKSSRAMLLEAGEALALTLPLIVRPLDSHAGNNLEKIETLAALADYLARVDGDAFYVSRFVDYAGADGLFRKYRVAMIGGVPYLAHLAISAHWMVHYMNAGMQHSAEKRAEEAFCMAHFDDTFARRHGEALRAVSARLDLPYHQLDCAEMRSGELLIFEAGTAMAVHAMDDEELFPYKRRAMETLFSAFGRLLADTRAGQRSGKAE